MTYSEYLRFKRCVWIVFVLGA